MQAAILIVFGLVLAMTPLGPARALETAAKQAIIVDYDTGAVLFEKNADQAMPPASMSKLMTIYMTFKALKDGRLKLDDTLPVSRKAWKMGGSKMFVRVGREVLVSDLLRGIIVQSGNDACIVIAEGLAGSEASFARKMTETARELGMTTSQFRNASGWPDPEHVMSARDLAILADHLIRDFPLLYRIFAEKTFEYSKIKQGNRNPLLYKDMGVDGLKTGHTQASGYGLVASGRRNGRRVIIVLNGLGSVNARARESQRLINWSFREFQNYALFKAGAPVERAEVWLGDESYVPLVLAKPLIVTLPRALRGKMKVKVRYTGPIPAPIIKGRQIAEVHIEVPGRKTIVRPLLAGETVARLGVVSRLFAAVKYLVLGPD